MGRDSSWRRRPTGSPASTSTSCAAPRWAPATTWRSQRISIRVILDGIPRLSPDNYDQARRFIVLVDTLYDQRVKLIASADAMPDQLYRRGENAKMFERTASRLDEMQSQDWLGVQPDA